MSQINVDTIKSRTGGAAAISAGDGGTNTGGGGGGGNPVPGQSPSLPGGRGGSGIVMIAYPI